MIETYEKTLNDSLMANDSLLVTRFDLMTVVNEMLAGTRADTIDDGVFGSFSEDSGVEFKTDKQNAKSYLQSRNYVAGTSGWRIDSSGTVEFGSGTFRGTITASTITGSTLTTGTTGKNITLTEGRMSQRSVLVEVAYSDVGDNGGFFGIKDSSGNSIGRWFVRNAGADVNFLIDVGDLFIQAADDILFVGSAGNNIYPATDNVMSLGLGSNRWSDIRSTLINGVTPLSGEKIYYVSDSSGGAVNRKLTFDTGILKLET